MRIYEKQSQVLIKDLSQIGICANAKQSQHFVSVLGRARDWRRDEFNNNAWILWVSSIIAKFQETCH